VPTEGAAAARGAGPAGSGTALDIVVASFRTETRAASVAAQVSGAGLPVHRRSVAGWQQVLAGPFATREQAEQAQQKLVRVGLSGTQIVVADR
jgi:cell division protein FtsN